MIIPTPQFEPVDFDLNGRSFFQRAKYIWDNPPRFRITADWIVTLSDGTKIIIPKGFVTDFASIPRILWAVPGFSPSGPLLWGAILHDFGYQYGYFLAVFNPSHAYSIQSYKLRAEYAAVFSNYIPIFAGRQQEFFDGLLARVTIKKTGAKFIARSAWASLQCFGGKVWNKYRTLGPTAYNRNSLGLPGITTKGPVF